MIESKILSTFVCLIAVGLMVWDQSRLKQMTRTKWALVPVLLAITVGYVWLPARL